MATHLQQVEMVDIETANGYKGVPGIEPASHSAKVFAKWDVPPAQEKISEILAKQFPPTANPAPLGLGAFALTTLVLSLMNAGGLRCKVLL